MDAQRRSLLAAVMGSFVAGLDATIVNVALPAVERDLGGGLAAQQWVANAYLLTLGSLILVGGSLGDLFGGRRVFALGVAGFGAASLLCAAAPAVEVLVAARALQGVFGALVTPSALAVIVSAFPASERAGAIGTWTAWSGVAFVVGPLAGGLLVEEASWRWIFAVNVPFVAVTLLLLAGGAERRRSPGGRTGVDWLGALLCTAGLAAGVFGLVRQPELGWADPAVAVPVAAGLALLAAFLTHERRSSRPMVPLDLFARRNFAAGNAQTFLMYAGLSLNLFVVTVFLQQVAGYSPIDAGLATLPTTLVMLALSKRMGELADRLGPRRFMGFGPLVAAGGLVLYQRVGPDAPYLAEVLPAVLVFALGLAMTVAPLTAAVLADADEHNAGIASGVNNAVARVAGLLGVAVVGVVAGERLTLDGFHDVMLLSAALVGAGGVLALAGVRDVRREVPCEHCPGGAVAGAPVEAVSDTVPA